MWYSILAYVRYLFASSTRYGVHSPFVYDFISKAMRAKLPKNKIEKLRDYRKSLSKDSGSIHVTDYGAGSRIFNSNNRRINKIAKHAGISKKKAIILQKIISFYQPKKILELGTSLGIGTAAMCISSPTSNIISIEGCPNTAKKALEYFTKFNFKNIELKIGKFSKILPSIYINNTFDLIYFDGNHQKNATIEYYNACLESVHNDTLLIFDDIHWSKGMEEAWNYIKQQQKVTVSIDLFHLGLIFFRKEQVKQDFILRY